MAHSKFRIQLPSMTPGSARHVVVHRFGTLGARPKVYLQAAVHANEFPGAMACTTCCRSWLEAERLGRIAGEVVVVPYRQPDRPVAAGGQQPPRPLRAAGS